MRFDPVTFGVIAAAIVVGATVQGTLGFGMNLLVAPVASIVVPEAVPATLILAAAPLTVAIVLREWRHVSWWAFRWTVLGRVPGTLLGVWLVATFAGPTIGVAVGVIVILGTLLTVPTGGVAVTPATSMAAGCASSAMGTASGVGGPPMALLFRSQDPATARATISASFTIGTTISLTALAANGSIDTEQVVGALALWPFVAAGFGLSRVAIGRIDAESSRRAVLVVAGLSGVAAIAVALT